MYDLIYAKKSGRALSRDQIAWWVRGTADGSVPDEQSAALLMAICWRGMDTNEILALTLAMRDSGRRLDLSGIPGTVIDKHSTGGVGDKTTLILGPVVGACGKGKGLSCAMISGRGLGHTGGTADKLSSIPNLRLELNEDEFKGCLQKTGFVNSVQTMDICPADRRLYALRDITATVESIPLITASIMSKKLAGGANALVLDVKRGSGAFMKNNDDAKILAEGLVAVGQAHGVKVKALITPMDEPLGQTIGNSLEVIESVEILNGQHHDGELAKLSFQLAAEMLVLGGVSEDLGAAYELVSDSIQSGSALQTFKEYVEFCGGDAGALDDFSRLPQAAAKATIVSPRSGTISGMDSRELGIFAMNLGAGRRNLSDVLDLGAGIRLHAKTGDTVEKGQPLFTIYCRDKSLIEPEGLFRALRFD